MKFAKILATGHYLPQKIITNYELSLSLDTSDEWITQRTGIKQRHIASDKETTVFMGVASAKQALVKANCQASDIDMILVATCSSEQIFPSTACRIQQELGINNCIAFDIQAACSGFIYGLSIASQFIANEQVNKILFIGTETMSKILDWKDRSTCVLFGDGAGAMILEAANQPGVLSTHLHADGNHQNILSLNKNSYVNMQGKAVFKLAVTHLEEAAIEAINHNKLTADNIDWLIPHQANIRIIQSTAKKLGISMEKVIVTVNRHANTSAASIPIALNIAIEDKRVKRGQNILLEAFGGGLTWGSALVRY